MIASPVCLPPVSTPLANGLSSPSHTHKPVRLSLCRQALVLCRTRYVMCRLLFFFSLDPQPAFGRHTVSRSPPCIPAHRITGHLIGHLHVKVKAINHQIKSSHITKQAQAHDAGAKKEPSKQDPCL